MFVLAAPQTAGCNARDNKIGFVRQYGQCVFHAHYASIGKHFNGSAAEWGVGIGCDMHWEGGVVGDAFVGYADARSIGGDAVRACQTGSTDDSVDLPPLLKGVRNQRNQGR